MHKHSTSGFWLLLLLLLVVFCFTCSRFFPTNNAFFSDLTPETLYVCSVVARNMFGASPPVVTAANTTMRTGKV